MGGRQQQARQQAAHHRDNPTATARARGVVGADHSLLPFRLWCWTTSCSRLSKISPQKVAMPKSKVRKKNDFTVNPVSAYPGQGQGRSFECGGSSFCSPA